MIDLNELQDSARQVLGAVEVPASEEATWAQIVELGWLLVVVPEDLDGLDLGLAGACVVHAELGRKLASAPYLPAILALDAVCQSSHGGRAAWVERLTSGDFATVPLVDSPLQLEGSQLSGVANAVQSADRACAVLVWAGDTLALVPSDQGGVTLTERPSWDRTRRLFDVAFNAVDMDPEWVLASGEEGARLIQRLLVQRDFALAADAVGGADGLLAITVEHLQTRQQFGRPLAMFQALKHRCADLKTRIATAEAALYDGLARCAGQLDDPQAASKGRIASFLGREAFAAMAEESLQLHGGIGMASEHVCHLYLKRSLLGEHLGRAGDRYEYDIADSLVGGVS